MPFGELVIYYFKTAALMAADPLNLVLLIVCTFLGILFGCMPGLTATLGVALLTTLTYGMPKETALIALLSIYVGAIYGGSYSAITINIPGTPASAATALDGYPMAKKGLAGKALGLTTTSSAIGTFIGMMFVLLASPLLAQLARQITSFEFFLLTFFGILISGSISSDDIVIKGWIAGFFGIFLAMVGRDPLQTVPRFTFGLADLESGIDVVPVLLGAFGIPQVILALMGKKKKVEVSSVQKVLPEMGTIMKQIPNIVRSSLIGVGIGSIPGIGEDIGAWVSYSAAKRASKHPEKFGCGSEEALVASETANNATIGGALMPLLTLGIPGSPPAAMLLGALMLHGVQPGPMLPIDRPTFIADFSAIILLAIIAMWIIGILLAKQVVKILRVPPTLFMPVIGVLCFLGSYALTNNIFYLYLMMIVGIIGYFMTIFHYPIGPMVIGVILGPMVDEYLRRALMVSKGSFMPVFTRPVSMIFFIIIVFTILGALPAYQNIMKKLKSLFARKKRVTKVCDDDQK